MRSSSEIHRDGVLLHEWNVHAFGNGVARRAIDRLSVPNSEIRRIVAEILGVAEESVSVAGASMARIQDLVEEAIELRSGAASAAYVAVLAELRRLVVHDVAYRSELLTRAVGVSGYAAESVDPQAVYDGFLNTTFGGRDLGSHFAAFVDDDARRFRGTVFAGLEQGQRRSDLMLALLGVGGIGGSLGVGSVRIGLMASAAVTHALAVAASRVYEANSGDSGVAGSTPRVVGAMLWVSVLDGRTSEICSSRDGRVGPPAFNVPIHRSFASMPRLDPPFARPPAHPRCRSSVIPLIVGEGITGDRRFVMDTRDESRREIDFVAEAGRRGVSVSSVRSEWERAHVGTIPASVSFEEWLRASSAKFQDAHLGRRLAAEFRAGRLTLSDIAKRSARQYDFDDLVREDEGSFDAIGL